MTSRLAGKIALITGAGQGAGRGIALAFAAEGASVVLVGRTMDKLERVADEVRDRGGQALPLQGDIGEPAQIDAVVDACVEHFETVDVLVNCAHHMTRSGSILGTDDVDVEALWTTGPRVTLQLMRRCHPFLCGGGSIINFGSSAQLNPVGYGVYAAMKDAIRSLSRTAAVEWGPDGIRVNMIAPSVESPSREADLARRGGGDSPRPPLGRIGDPERDIGRMCVFLASDESGYLTGELLMLDGGGSYHR